MKHWHYSAKVYERGSMALINISSGIITTPNSMGANETMGYLSNMVADQQERKDVEISFDAFSLVESDDTEPTAPLTDEDIAQHRHDDKIAAAIDLYDRWDATPPQRNVSPGLQEQLDNGWIISEMNGFYSPDEFELKYYVDLKGGNVLLRKPIKTTAGAEPIHVPVTVKWVDESDCICWQCGKPQNSVALANNDFECLNCHIQVADDLTPCITCGKVITRPGGAHYCNRKDADSTNS